MKHYVKRVVRAVLNKPYFRHTQSKTYVIDSKKRFENKVVVITGASGAIGSATAKRFALEGARVYLGGRNTDKLEALAGEIKALGGIGYPCPIDVTDEKTVETAADFVLEKAGRIDVLVNCAGGSAREKAKELVEQETQVIDEIILLNLRGSMLCTKTFGKYMKKQGYGKIVNVSSAIGEFGKPRFTDYAAAKAGIIGYTKSVAQELGKYGVNVNCVSPGFIQRGDFDDDMLAYLKRTSFINRVGAHEDAASAIAFMASDDAGFITGQNLFVDGGRTLGLHGD